MSDIEILKQLDGIGLKSSEYICKHGHVFHFKIATHLKGNWKKNVISSLQDLIKLCETYIEDLEEMKYDN